MVTSIQVHEDTKAFLNTLKNDKESYDDLIKKLARFYENKKKVDEMVLEDGYRENYDVSKKVYDDLEGIDAKWPEW